VTKTRLFDSWRD